jgi:hypothetical protein
VPRLFGVVARCSGTRSRVRSSSAARGDCLLRRAVPLSLGRSGADGNHDLMSRTARGLLPHDGENSLGPPAIALHHAFQLGPPVRRHAEAIDDNVADLVRAVARAQAPIDSDWLKHRAVSHPRAGFASELAGDDCPIWLGPATDRPQTTAAIGVLRGPSPLRALSAQ